MSAAETFTSDRGHGRLRIMNTYTAADMWLAELSRRCLGAGRVTSRKPEAVTSEAVPATEGKRPSGG